jgi:penicillin-binding protein-related factor A (putative recombinase)
MAAIMSEKDLENRILDWLNSLDKCFAFKINTTGVYDPKKKVFRKNNGKHLHNGTSDIIGEIDGRFFAIEVKYGYNKPSENQIKFIERIKDNGGVSFWTNDFEKCKIAFFKYFPNVRTKGELLFEEIL